MDRNNYKNQQELWLKETKAVVGSTVKITHTPAKELCGAMGWYPDWVSDMTAVVGEQGKINGITNSGLRVYCKGQTWNYPFFALTLVENPIPTAIVNLTSEYTAEVTSDGVVVGCQTIPFEAIDLLIVEIEKVRPKLSPLGVGIPYRDAKVGDYLQWNISSDVYHKVAPDKVVMVYSGKSWSSNQIGESYPYSSDSTVMVTPVAKPD